jgi:hypothetical protein
MSGQGYVPNFSLHKAILINASFSEEPLRHKHKGKNERQGLRQKGPARVWGCKCENPKTSGFVCIPKVIRKASITTTRSLRKSGSHSSMLILYYSILLCDDGFSWC